MCIYIPTYHRTKSGEVSSEETLDLGLYTLHPTPYTPPYTPRPLTPNLPKHASIPHNATSHATTPPLSPDAPQRRRSHPSCHVIAPQHFPPSPMSHHPRDPPLVRHPPAPSAIYAIVRHTSYVPTRHRIPPIHDFSTSHPSGHRFSPPPSPSALPRQTL